MLDFYPLEAEDSIKKVLAMDWDKLIPGHPVLAGGSAPSKTSRISSRSCRTLRRR